MIGTPLSTICGGLEKKISELCQCIRDYAQQPGVMPCNAYPLFFRGSISQTFNCHVAAYAFTVPKGQVATITRVSLTERYPGTLYGANFFLLVNDIIDPTFPRLDHATSTGLETGRGTRVCLQEQDIVSVMLQCSWFPAEFTGQESTYVQTLFPWELEGYFEYKVVA